MNRGCIPGGLLIDGNYGQILDDLPDMEIDVFTTVDVNMTGIELLKEKLKGKICLKATVDMQRTLPLGTPDEVEKEAQELVNNLNTPDGGFICEVVRWYRPSYRDENVLASVRAFNRFRKGV
jgi:uroporphyrinogen decarboxylase